MFLFSFLFGKLLGRIVSLAVVLLVVAGAGWYFFIREDNEVQKEAAPITDAVRAAASASPAPSASAVASSTAASSVPSTAPQGASSLAGTRYSIIEGQSLAWYLAPEKLARLPTSSVAKGTTSDVMGQFNFSTAGLDPAKPTTFTVGLKELKSDESRRDDRAQSALETSKFPSATFIGKTLAGMPKEFTATDSVMQLAGTLDLHGIKQEVVWELKVKKDGDILSGLGTVKFRYSDFGIKKPDIGGFVTVEEEVTLQIQLFAKPG